MTRTRIALVTTLFLIAVALPLDGRSASRRERSDRPEKLPTIAEATRGMTARSGLLRFHADGAGGTIWLELPAPAEPRGEVAELLYVEGLRTGLGSNPVGLDRGQLGETRWVVLRRVGPRVLLEVLNPAFRAQSDEPAERAAARESFATSVLWGGDIAALDADGRSLVDFTSFLVRDAHGVRGRLSSRGQGQFELDPGRSAVDLEQCLAFPDNVEFEALLTFGGNEPGGEVRRTAPSPDAVSLVQHHSLIRVPDDGYRPRRFDPRAGSFGIEFLDYATPLDRPVRRSWIARHRLEKLDPAAERSRVREPIVFYVDRGAPEPVRGALLDGAGWWAQAFDAAGFIDAYRVELLPADVHPLDVRYNVIQWVHRATRGWSYGGGVIDPRTGEFLKGHVSLGSLRVRQDRLLFEGLAGTERTGSGGPDDPIQLALARIRQLAAHEVGHALGLTHNFAASTYAGRASVMDYPAPLVQLDRDGELDFRAAYGVGVGAWDRHAIRYAYAEFPRGDDERKRLDGIVREGIEGGLLFLTDEDARPASASDPRASLWDNGDDPVQALLASWEVRRRALARFGEGNVLPGTPLAHLEEVLAPLYFHHRFQLDAAVKTIGGMEYEYAVRGDGRPPTRIVSARRQRQALDAVLGLLDPEALDLPDRVLRLLPPRPHGEAPNREMFDSGTWPAFDIQGAVATAAAQIIDGLLQPERLGRLVEFHRRDPSLPGADELLKRLTDRVFQVSSAAGATGRRLELQRSLQSVLVQRLSALVLRPNLRPTLRARAEGALVSIRARLAVASEDDEGVWHARSLVSAITRVLDRTVGSVDEPVWEPAPPPPGSPIGCSRGSGLGF